MAEKGDTHIGNAYETLATLRASAAEGMSIQTSFPNAGYDMYIAFFPDCGHYLVRVMKLGAEPSDLSSVLIQEAELSEEDVLWRMCALMDQDIARDPMGADARTALEMLMVEEG